MSQIHEIINEGLESIHILNTPLLGVGVCVSCSRKALSDYFSAPWIEDIDARGFVAKEPLITPEGGGCTVICFNPDEFNIGVIAHESVHAARCIMRRAGIPNNNGTEEILAYLVEWLTDAIVEYFNDSGWTDWLCAEGEEDEVRA